MTTPPGPADPVGPASTGPGPMPLVADAVPGAPTPTPPLFDPAAPVIAPVARDVDALAEPVARAVLACTAVAALSAGPFGTVGTYLPGRRVSGVQITDDAVTVRVIAYPVPLRTLENQIRTAVAALVPGLPIDIGLDDVVTDIHR